MRRRSRRAFKAGTQSARRLRRLLILWAISKYFPKDTNKLTISGGFHASFSCLAVAGLSISQLVERQKRPASMPDDR